MRSQRSRFTHYYFYLRDEVLGPIAMRVGSFGPLQATGYLNGHSFVEQEFNRRHIGFCRHDNAFPATDDVGAPQAADDRLSPEIIRPRLDHWTLILGRGSVRYPGLKIHETRLIRLLELLLPAGNDLGARSAQQIHQTVLTTFRLSAHAYGLNQSADHKAGKAIQDIVGLRHAA